MSNKREQLLRKAIYCYQQAGMIDDVCRCLEKLGDYLAAARIHEQQQRWLPAAEAYRQAQAWLDAARCYWQCEHSFAEEAAECFVKAGERLQAAWVYAEGAQRFYRARLLLQETPIESLVEEVSRDLILARCEVGIGSAQKAGFFVHNVLTRFPELPLGYRQRIENWAVTVAQRLSRFDLVATAYAIAYTTGTPDSEKRWEAWALSELGDATGVPTTPSLTDNTFAFETVTVSESGEIIKRTRHQATQIIEVVNGIEIAMVYMPCGSFLMGSPEDEEGRELWHEGSESPQHLVSIAPFYMGKYPVTQAQWQAVMGDNPSHFKGDNRPVEVVSWDDAIVFCNKLSQLTGNSYRLPSEAEWEYACRGGTTTPFSFGQTITTDLANYYGNLYLCFCSHRYLSF